MNLASKRKIKENDETEWIRDVLQHEKHRHPKETIFSHDKPDRSSEPSLD